MGTNPSMELTRQKMQETRLERASRSLARFPSFESALPKVGSRLNIPFKDQFFSYLGRRNPLAAPARPSTESVWLLDNTAYRPQHPYPHAEQPWQAEFTAAYFARNSGKDVSKWVADIADKAGLSQMGLPEGEGERIIAERLQPFVDTIRPGKYVDVVIPGGRGKRLGPGARNAISSQVVGALGEHEEGHIMETKAEPEELTPHGEMLTHFAGPEGWAVISGKSSFFIQDVATTIPPLTAGSSYQISTTL